MNSEAPQQRRGSARDSHESERRLAQLVEGIQAFNRGDVEPVLAILDPDVETHIDGRLMNPGTRRGHAGYLEMVSVWTEAWGSVEAEFVDVSEPDEQHLLTEVHQRAVGAGSGVPVEMNLFWLFEFRGGRVIRFHMYPDRESALAAIP
jgi:ketosteroid isomerase-like protein